MAVRTGGCGARPFEGRSPSLPFRGFLETANSSRAGSFSCHSPFFPFPLLLPPAPAGWACLPERALLPPPAAAAAGRPPVLSFFPASSSHPPPRLCARTHPRCAAGQPGSRAVRMSGAGGECGCPGPPPGSASRGTHAHRERARERESPMAIIRTRGDGGAGENTLRGEALLRLSAPSDP